MARMVQTPFSNILRLDEQGGLTITMDHGFSGPNEVMWSGAPLASVLIAQD